MWSDFFQVVSLYSICIDGMNGRVRIIRVPTLPAVVCCYILYKVFHFACTIAKRNLGLLPRPRTRPLA